ncbi:transforming growth factor beta regulator 1 [Mortierella sp. NVP85]|nr:transforming growth factor beta regulator 1 [Mortierella sp. NVP85]
MDDLSDFDDEDEDEVKEEGLSDQRQGRLITKRTDANVDRRTLTNKSRRDASSDHGAQLAREYMDTAGASSSTISNITNGNLLHHTINARQASRSSDSSSSSSTNGDGGGGGGDGGSSSGGGGGGGGGGDASAPPKRADRGRPRAVVPLPTNPDGSLNYPIVVGRGTNEVIIENMGRIVWQGRGYHNHRYIFPVGFRSKKQYTSLSDTSKKTYFINEILDGGDQPIFQITLEDMPEKIFRHTSSSGAWELALKGLMELGYNAKTHASGPDMYGLTNLGVIKYIQEMPNANRCRRYMPLKWIIQDDPNSLQSGDPAGNKSPGRKKKITNSLYASNHEVLMETLQEESRSGAASLSRPSPRKYTKRKTVATTPPMALAISEERNHSSSASPMIPPAPGPDTGSGIDYMEDVKQEVEYSGAALIPTPSTAATSPMSGQEPPFPNAPEMQKQDGYQDKVLLHQYGHPSRQSMVEP